MPTIGLIVDGLFDQRAITALINKQRPKVAVKARQCGGGRKNSKAIGLLKTFEYRRDVNFAIWVTDAEADDPIVVEGRMTETVEIFR